MKTVLSLDMSTTCTGWSLLDVDAHALVSYGIIKGKSKKGTSKYRETLIKMKAIADQILNLIINLKPTYIVIEEIAGSKNRIGQKTLDMLHGIVWNTIDPYLDIVEYYDVTGVDGWRTHLGLRLTENDKLANKEAKKLNPNLSKGSQLPVYNAKDLACRYANETFGLALDPQVNQYDSDIADSVSMGSAYIKFKFPHN